MKTKYIKLFLTILAMSGPWTSSSVLADAKQQSRFKTADDHYHKRTIETEARAALKIYHRLYLESPRSAEAAWKYSMASYYVGHHFAKTDGEAEKLFEKGEDSGRMGYLFNEDCAPCYFWASVNNLLWGQKGGNLRLIFVIRSAQKNLRKMNEIDEKYGFAGGWRTLGQIEAGLPGFFGGSNDRAKRYFEKAISLTPKYHINYLYLAKLHLEHLKQKQKGLSVAQKALTLPKPLKHDVENVNALRDLKNLIEQNKSTQITKSGAKSLSSK